MGRKVMVFLAVVSVSLGEKTLPLGEDFSKMDMCKTIVLHTIAAIWGNRQYKNMAMYMGYSSRKVSARPISPDQEPRKSGLMWRSNRLLVTLWAMVVSQARTRPIYFSPLFAATL